MFILTHPVNFLVGGNRSARRKPTTFGRVWTSSFHMRGALGSTNIVNVVTENRTRNLRGERSDHYAIMENIKYERFWTNFLLDVSRINNSFQTSWSRWLRCHINNWCRKILQQWKRSQWFGKYPSRGTWKNGWKSITKVGQINQGLCIFTTQSPAWIDE